MKPGEIKKKAREVLGVSEGVKTDEIRLAYWKLAKKHHPDLNGGDRSTAEQFKLISEAYEILTGEKNVGRYNMFKTDLHVSKERPFEGDKGYWKWWKERFGDLI